MGSLQKRAEQVLNNLPIAPANGNVMNYIHHNVLRGVPVRECRQVVNYLIDRRKLIHEGHSKHPTALRPMS